MSHMNKRFVHLGGGGAWWSIGNHGRIVFVAIYCTFMLISNIFKLYLVHTMYDGCLCTRATKEGKNVKPTVDPIPPKVIVQAVFIFLQVVSCGPFFHVSRNFWEGSYGTAVPLQIFAHQETSEKDPIEQLFLREKVVLQETFLAFGTLVGLAASAFVSTS